MMKKLMRLAVLQIVFVFLAVNITLVFMDTTLIWLSLCAPPGKAVKIEKGDAESVLVETISGQEYYCRFRYGKECWVIKALPKFKPSHEDNTWLKSYREAPKLWAKVANTKTIYTQISEYSFVKSVYAVRKRGGLRLAGRVWLPV